MRRQFSWHFKQFPFASGSDSLNGDFARRRRALFSPSRFEAWPLRLRSTAQQNSSGIGFAQKIAFIELVQKAEFSYPVGLVFGVRNNTPLHHSTLSRSRRNKSI